MTDEQYNELVEAIRGNTISINELHRAIVGLIEEMYKIDSDDQQEATNYLDGKPIQ